MADKELLITGSASGISQLSKIINNIKSRGNTGHSYSIVLDPDDKNPGEFGWDGDGSDRIDKIEDNMRKDDKRVESIILETLGSSNRIMEAQKVRPNDFISVDEMELEDEELKDLAPIEKALGMSFDRISYIDDWAPETHASYVAVARKIEDDGKSMKSFKVPDGTGDLYNYKGVKVVLTYQDHRSLFVALKDLKKLIQVINA